MTISTRATPSSVAAIVRLLDDGFAGIPARPGEAPEEHQVPAAVWERALLGPLREFLRRPGKAFRGRLVEASWHVARGRFEPVPELLPIIIEALHAGSLIVDDIEDGGTERRGSPALHDLVGTPVALNAGNWLYVWPQDLLARMDLAPTIRARLHEEIHLALLRCHQGQALDLSVRVFDLASSEVPPVVRALSRLKTGSLVELAATLGAIAAGATDRVVRRLADFGRDVGVGLQMLDDLAGLIDDERQHKADEDLRSARATWPWAWLANDCTPDAFAAALGHLRAISEGASSHELCAWMRTELSSSGRTRAQEHIARAVRVLQAELGDGPPVLALCREVTKLEAGYARK